MQKSCLALYSGGLDSILACRVLMAQGIHLVAIKFITPFFGWDTKGREEEVCRDAVQRFGIPLVIQDISRDYIEMLKTPAHGYGRYFNPCIDCKILMVRKALEMMPDYNASFIATGEVLGQRPMSQRRDTLRIIERESGAEGLILRPLSATHLPPTRPQQEGIVDIGLLPAITGRGRKTQIALAREFGIKEYPSPGGGCVLADPILSVRFKVMVQEFSKLKPEDFVMAQKGRHFRLPGKSWIAVGRNRQENIEIEELALPGDLLARPDLPGPTALIRYWHRDDLDMAARIVDRYAKPHHLPHTISFWCKEGGDTERDIFTRKPFLQIQVNQPISGQLLDDYRF